MKKSNWLIMGIFVIASIMFLAMWYALGFNLVDNPRDLVITIAWWLVIVGVCIAIKLAENKRRRSLRTSFIAQGLIYNPEAGIVRLGKEQAYTSALEQLLESLNYDFEMTDISNDKRIRFKYIVHTDKFADKGDVWVGEVVKVSSPDNAYPFSNRLELSRLIDAA